MPEVNGLYTYIHSAIVRQGITRAYWNENAVRSGAGCKRRWKAGDLEQISRGLMTTTNAFVSNCDQSK